MISDVLEFQESRYSQSSDDKPICPYKVGKPINLSSVTTEQTEILKLSILQTAGHIELILTCTVISKLEWTPQIYYILSLYPFFTLLSRMWYVGGSRPDGARVGRFSSWGTVVPKGFLDESAYFSSSR